MGVIRQSLSCLGFAAACAAADLLPLQLQSASRAPQSFTSAGMSDVGSYGGGSLPVNGLTAHQSQVGASIFKPGARVSQWVLLQCELGQRNESLVILRRLVILFFWPVQC